GLKTFAGKEKNPAVGLAHFLFPFPPGHNTMRVSRIARSALQLQSRQSLASSRLLRVHSRALSTVPALNSGARPQSCIERDQLMRVRREGRALARWQSTASAQYVKALYIACCTL